MHRLLYCVSQQAIAVANDNVVDNAFGGHENKRGDAVSPVRPNTPGGPFRVVPVVPEDSVFF